MIARENKSIFLRKTFPDFAETKLPKTANGIIVNTLTFLASVNLSAYFIMTLEIIIVRM